jgi:integrase
MKTILESNEIMELENDKFPLYFNTLEYFSANQPMLVKNYISNIREQLYQEYNNSYFIGRISCLKYMTNTLNGNYTGRFYTAKILPLSHTDHIIKEVFNIKRKNFDSITGKQVLNTNLITITFSGIIPRLNSLFTWDLNGIQEKIFLNDGKSDVYLLSKKIQDWVENIDNIVTNHIGDTLINIDDNDQIRVLNIYSKLFEVKLTEYLAYFAEKLTEMNVLLNSSQHSTRNYKLLTHIFKLEQSKDTTSRLRRLFGMRFYEIVDKVTSKESIRQVNILINSNNFDIIEDKWELFFILKKKLDKKNFYFDDMKNSTIKREFKLYMKSLLEKELKSINTERQNKHLSDKITHYQNIKQVIDFLIERYGINSTSDITQDMISDVISSMELNGLGQRTSGKNGLPLSPTTIQRTIYNFKNFTSYIIRNANALNTLKPKINPCNKISFNSRAIKALRKQTKIIPDIVIDQLKEQLDYLNPSDIRRMLLIFLNTPRRFDEIQLLNANCLSPLVDENGSNILDNFGNKLYELTFLESKKEKNKSLIKHSYNNSFFIRKVAVNHVVAREIYEQINSTKELRKKSNTNYIFIRPDDTKVDGWSFISQVDYVTSVQALITTRNIIDDDKKLWRFTVRQTRKTCVYILVKNGATLNEIQYLLQHKSSKTTTDFYIEVRKIALADINTKFFKDEFDKRLNKQEQLQYTSEELELLFYNFCIETRKVYYNRKQLGVCTLKPGEKCPFSNTKDDFPCAGCSSLETGNPCIEAWKELLTDIEANIKLEESFILELDKSNISLSNFPSYNIDKLKYLQALSTLEAIEQER